VVRERRPPDSRPAPGPGDALPEGRHPSEHRWIVDGHNAIFAVRAWEDLQVEGRRREARLALEESLEVFGRAVGVQVWVVYDGNRLERNPDARDDPHLKTWYSNPPEEADDRIIFLALGSLRQGERPLVVTSDRRTLGSRLPAGVRVMAVERFFRGVHPRFVRAPEKWEPEGCEDIERYFLGLEAPAESGGKGDGEASGERGPDSPNDLDPPDPGGGRRPGGRPRAGGGGPGPRS
jgi:predicted RNA-binding protein with PIN domain